MSLENTAVAFKVLADLRRKEAETLYVVAVLAAQSGLTEIAAGSARECVKLLASLGTDTMEECATRSTVVAGVALPEFLHEDVVRERLAHHGITL